MKSVRNGLLVALLVMVGGISAAIADVGVVDMERLIKQHPRTSSDRAILEQYVEDFEDERETMVDDLKALTEEFEKLRLEAEDVGLSEKALASKRNLAKAKVDEIRQRERELREIASKRQKELTSQELRMRKRVVSDISKIIDTIAAKKKLDLVLDATGLSVGGYPSVLFYSKKLDITDDVIGELPQAAE